MNSPLLLSICIPTYNRVSYLKECIESIVNQTWYSDEKVEIIISDNASTDSTAELIESYAKRYKNIHYSPNLENIGADRNIIKILQMGNGKYIWGISDDDIVLPEAFDAVLELLETNTDPDIWLFQTNFDVLNTFDTSKKDIVSYLWKEKTTTVFANIHELYKSYNYRHNGLSFFSIHIFSSQIHGLDIWNIPITQYPHSCVAWLIGNKKAMFLWYSAIGFRQNNSSIENMGSFKVFFRIFVTDFLKYKNFLKVQNSYVSQKELLLLLCKMFVYSLFFWLKWCIKHIKERSIRFISTK